MEELSISVVVPSYNGAARLSILMEALVKQNFKAFEVVVVLDGSTDNSESVLEGWNNQLELNIVNQTNKGRAGARNRGAKEAKGELIVFLDDDMQPDPDVVFFHKQLHEETPDIIVVGQQIEKQEKENEFSFFKAWLTAKWVEKFGRKPVKLNSANLFLTAANMSIRKVRLQGLNGFDEALSDAEDFDLAARAYLEDILIIYDPNNRSYHRSFSSFRSYIIRQRQYRSAHEKLAALRPSSEFANLHRKFRAQKDPLKKILYFPVAGFMVKMMDKGYFRVLSAGFRYRIYQRIISALSLYYPKRKL